MARLTQLCCWKVVIILILTSVLFTVCPFCDISQGEQPSVSEEITSDQKEEPTKEDGLPKLKTAYMCEEIKNGNCERASVVFAVDKKQVFCYSLFEEIPSSRIIYHRWYRRGDLTTQIRLRLQPPKWATYSSIQLRESDKGPWQVEIVDESGKIYATLRFSITE